MYAVHTMINFSEWRSNHEKVAHHAALAGHFHLQSKRTVQ